MEFVTKKLEEFTAEETRTIVKFAIATKNTSIFFNAAALANITTEEKKAMYIEAYKNRMLHLYVLERKFPNEDFSELALSYDFYNSIIVILRKNRNLSDQDMIKYFEHPGFANSDADNRYYSAHNLLKYCPNASEESLKKMYDKYPSTRIRAEVLKHNNCPRYCFEKACKSRDKKVIHAAIRSKNLPEDLVEQLVLNWLKIFPEDCRSYRFKEDHFSKEVKEKIEYLRQVVDILE